ncbi:polysaccharide deacetylase family protein [Streptomyces boluensis]|uniref:Polysaccharide deacetylase family protein n=1 Tax=Streptomyces boluensis TaxID=1775135 RepID=A0A964US22_9ACTN|nr:polysaccharide deacetylase family protein [Streptomyces boluensis]NBE53727.1 polysaccharide deacetylase family protein [Streptomyces boluensis]
MQLVRQNEKFVRNRATRIRVGIAVVTASALASGCAGGGGQQAPVQPAHGQQHADQAKKRAAAHVAMVAAVKRWKVAKMPLVPPKPPTGADKKRINTRKGFEVAGQKNLPPVFTTVPTKDKVVFLTIDDGAEKDPEFLKMMSELKIPYTAFLSNYLVKGNYGYFKKMQARGVGLNNHTLTHRYMPGLSYAQQKREICGMQDVIQKQYGKRPELFRPPYGNYNRDTLKAAKACGVKAVPLWNAEAFADRMDWREWDRDLHPGDIILTHFRGKEDWKGTMPDMIRRLLKTVTDKGYSIARLEDYL